MTYSLDWVQAFIHPSSISQACVTVLTDFRLYQPHKTNRLCSHCFSVNVHGSRKVRQRSQLTGDFKVCTNRSGNDSACSSKLRIRTFLKPVGPTCWIVTWMFLFQSLGQAQVFDEATVLLSCQAHQLEVGSRFPSVQTSRAEVYL